MKMEKTYDSMAILKGLGAVVVCSAHTLDCFVWKNGNNVQILNDILNMPFIWYFLWSGGVQVYIFCLISGYFSWNKEIDNFRELFIAITKRYLNFFTMILTCNMLGYVLLKIGAFPIENAKIALLYEDLPFQDNVQLILLLKNSLMLKSPMNGAMWMIGKLFLGNVCIYILKYLKKILKKYICLISLVVLV